MSRKNKVKKITDEQYLAYIAGLKEDKGALFDSNGDMLIPDSYIKEKKTEE